MIIYRGGPPQGTGGVAKILRAYGVEFRKGHFWKTNQDRLHYVYHDFSVRARELKRDHHPDRGGKHDDYVRLLNEIETVERAFARRGVGKAVLTPAQKLEAKARRPKRPFAIAVSWKVLKERRKARRYRKLHPEKVRQWRENYKVSAERRGIVRKKWKGKPARQVKGSPEYRHRKVWRKKQWAKNKERINAARRAKRAAPPRTRDAKGRYEKTERISGVRTQWNREDSVSESWSQGVELRFGTGG